MKIITFLTTFIFTVGFLFSQELTLKYEISMQSDDPQIQSQLGMMQGSTLQVFTKDNKSRTEMSMGGLMTTTTILDSDAKKGVLLMDGMLGKQGATFEDKEETEENEDFEYEVELINETKEILGHTCKKAVIYTEEDMELIYWYTEDFDVKAGSLGKYVKDNVPGLALEFSVEQPQMTMTFTATEFKEKVKETKGMFDLEIPEGYTEKSFEEIQGMSGQ